MANTLHIKGSRNKVLNTFPTNTFGKDGDIVASRISGRGTFLCIKAGGMWYVANQLQELRNLGKTSLRELKARNVHISQLTKSNKKTDGSIKNLDSFRAIGTNSCIGTSGLSLTIDSNIEPKAT